MAGLMAAYYNEIDPKAAAWLRELIRCGHIAKGEVDERSILEVSPADLRGFTQCHFFAGIGVWSYALRRAGWADDRPVWTGSCPCQPFSAAGKGDEFADERHLWPAWFRLARELRPDAIFGEQVSSKDALAWFDHVRVDLEGEGYALGVLDTCAAGVGAPETGQRLYFVAETEGGGCGIGRDPSFAWGSGHTDSREPIGRALGATNRERCKGTAEGAGAAGRGFAGDPGATNGFWAVADWVRCIDPEGERWRPVEPGTFPLVTGAPARVVRLRGYGNAINADQAKEFILAFRDVTECS